MITSKGIYNFFKNLTPDNLGSNDFTNNYNDDLNLLKGAMTGNNPTDWSNMGPKRHILTDKKGIPLSVVISLCQYS